MRSFGRRSLLVLGASLLGARGALAEEPVRRVFLQPLGPALTERDVSLVERALRAFYRVELIRLPSVPLPRAAYYAPRRRYRAELLLDFLAPRLPSDGHRILGLTGQDISTTKGEHHDWGVLGLATVDGSACVLSAHRCGRGARDAEHRRTRFAKTAVHELGHTFGLGHCPTRGCLMEDAQGTVFTTDREVDLCPETRATLAQRGYLATPGEVPPWVVP